MKTSDVKVVSYNSEWPEDFAEIKAELENGLGDLMITVEHLGSTSVAGLSAKPIIDLDSVICDYRVFDAVKEKLAELGYSHEGDLGIKDREAFKYEGKTHLREHHLYVCPQGSRELARHIAFRNFLRANHWAVTAYSEVKIKAAALFPNDIEKYLAYKAPWIEKIYQQIERNEHDKNG